MKRILLISLGLLVVACAGGYLYLKSNLEVITSGIGRAVESATGKPLILDAPPSLSVFPQLGLEVTKARWGDAKKDDISVTFDHAVVRVDLMALLNKRIDVNEVILDSPRVVYRLDDKAAKQDKAVSPASGGSSASSSTDKASGSPDLKNLSLSAVRITNGDVRVVQLDMDMHLTKLDLALKDFVVGKPGSLQVDTRLALRQGKTLTEADVALKTGFVLQLPSLKLQDCTFKLTPLKGLPVTKPVALSGKMDIDTARLLFSQADLSIDFAGSRIQAKGQASAAGPAGEFTINVQSALRETLTACGVSLNTQDPKALGALELAGKVKVNGGRADLSELKGKLDDTALSGNLSVSSVSLEGAIKLGSLNVDRYLPAKSAAPAPSGKSLDKASAKSSDKAMADKAQAGKPMKAEDYPGVRLDLAVDSLTVQNMVFAGLKALIHGGKGQYVVDPCTFKFYEAAVALAARAQLIGDQYSLKASVDKLNAGALIKDMAKTDKVKGRVNLQADMSVRGTDEASIRRSLGGTARLTGKLDVDTGLLPSGWGQLVRDIRTINVDNIDVVAKADKGKIALKPIAASGQVTVNGQGTVDLPADSLDVRLDTTLAGLTLPLYVRGSLGNPSYGIDAAETIKKVLEDPKAAKAIERGLKGLIKKVR